MARTCLVITHVAPRWSQSKRLTKNIDRLIEEIRPNAIVSLEVPGSRSKYVAAPYSSNRGEVPIDVLDRILNHDEVFVVGNYWTMCHERTFTDISGTFISRRKPVDMKVPLNCTTDPRFPNGTTLVSDVFDSDEFGAIGEDIDCYGRIFKFDGEDPVLSISKIPYPIVMWSYRPTLQVQINI